jgi:hypothetical protein
MRRIYKEHRALARLRLSQTRFEVFFEMQVLSVTPYTRRERVIGWKGLWIGRLLW